MNQDKFLKAIDIVKNQTKSNIIGTLSEKTLHAVVKNYYEENLENHEIKVGSFYADIFKDNKIIEIQTKHFNKLRTKLDYFLDKYPVRIIYPTFYNKWISWINPETSEVSNKRLSPKRGSIYQIFPELYRIKQYLKDPNLSITIILIDIEEFRYLNGWSINKKRGSSCYERIPIKVIEELAINDISDYSKFIPSTLSTFTSKDYAKSTKITLRNAQIALNILAYLNIIENIGKQDKYKLYKVIKMN